MLTHQEQVTWWLKGISVHSSEQECCPDYSCCHPNLLAPLEEREAFAEAFRQNDQQTYFRLGMMFLGRFMLENNIPPGPVLVDPPQPWLPHG